MSSEAQNGVIPPNSKEIEECVLSALISFEDAYMSREDSLDIQLFYTPKHVTIFKAISELFDMKTGIDMMTVCQRLTETKQLDSVGGYLEVSKISMITSSEYHLDDHIKILREKMILRYSISFARSMMSKAFDPNIDLKDFVDTVQSEVLDLGKGFKNDDPVNAIEAMKQEQISRKDPKAIKTYTPCHIDKIQRFVSSQYIVIAARPQHGKSAFMLDVADRQAQTDYPVAVFSLEMKYRENIYRLWMKHTGLNPNDIKDNRLSESQEQELSKVIDYYEGKSLYFMPETSLNTSEFKAKARRLVKSHGVKVIYIDYIQLMTHKGASNREREVSEISRCLKETGLELDVTIVALSQLNRKIEERPISEQFGQLSDLRESGSIEQDANTVMFLTNFDVLGIKEISDDDGNVKSVEGKAMLDVAKAREGGRGRELLTHSNNCMKWDTCLETKNEMPF